MILKKNNVIVVFKFAKIIGGKEKVGVFWTVLLIILGVLLVVFIALFIIGKRVQKKQAEQEEVIESSKQTVSMLIIDKKKMPLKDAGLPSLVLENTPKLMRRAKMPIVKAKVGPQIMTFISEPKVFEQIPVKKEVKVTVSGLYIVGVKGIRGSLEKPEEKKKKKSKYKQFKEELQKKAGARPLE